MSRSADRFPFEALNPPFRYVARSAFKFLGPHRRDPLVGLFETGQHVLGKAGAIR